LPRLIALLARQFDPIWTPALYNYLALLVSALMGLCLISPRMPGGRLGGLAMALLLLIAPNYSGEVFLTPTNLQWVTAPVMVALLIKSPPASMATAVMEAFVMFLIGVTTPFSIVLVPLAGVWVWSFGFRRRVAASDALETEAGTPYLSFVERADRFRLMMGAALTLAAVIQAGAVLHSAHLQLQENSNPKPMSLEIIVQAIGFRTVVEAFFPQLPTGDGIVRLVIGIVTLGVLGALALFPGKYRPMRMLLVGVILAFLGVTLVRCWGMGNALLDDGLGDRYFYPIRIQLMWCFLLAGLDAWSARHWSGIWCGFLLGLAVVASIRVYRVPPWPDEHWANYVPAIREGRPVDIPLNPLWVYHYPGRRPVISNQLSVIGNQSKVQSPRSKVPSPESAVQSPETRVPDSSVNDPDSTE
jgi:hypothetical protein